MSAQNPTQAGPAFRSEDYLKRQASHHEAITTMAKEWKRDRKITADTALAETQITHRIPTWHTNQSVQAGINDVTSTLRGQISTDDIQELADEVIRYLNGHGLIRMI